MKETLVDLGADHILIELPSNQRLPEIYDLSFLLEFPNISEPSAQAFRRHAANLRSTTRTTYVKQLRRGIFAFLTQRKMFELELRQIDRSLWSAFLLWLDQPKSRGESWVPLTRRSHLFAAVSLFKALASLPQWAPEGARIVAETPRGAYPAAERKVIPRQRLAMSDLMKIKAAAENAVRAIVGRFDEADRLLAVGEAKLMGGNENFKTDFAVCFAAITRRYPQIIPPKDILKRDLEAEGSLGRKLFYAARHHTYRKFHAYRYALSDDLVPFVILLSIATALNPEQILTLKEKNIGEVEMLGSSFVRIEVFKARAGKTISIQMPKGGTDEVGPHYLFRQLSRITERLRSFSGEYEGYCFLFRQAGNTWNIVGFGGARRTATMGAFSAALHRFCEKRGLPKFGLAQIRPTLGDEYRSVSGAIAAAKSLGHKAVDTMDRHYTSDNVRKKDQLRIAEVQALFGRWTQSEGRVDPRSNSRGHLDKGAATPGFSCVDPYSSPIESQRGRHGLCQAYGECPACPLARAHPNDPLAVAFYFALRLAIYKAAAGRVAPPAWRRKWAPIVQALNNLIATVPASVVARAPDLPAALPPVG